MVFYYLVFIYGMGVKGKFIFKECINKVLNVFFRVKFIEKYKDIKYKLYKKLM